MLPSDRQDLRLLQSKQGGYNPPFATSRYKYAPGRLRPSKSAQSLARST